MRQIKFRAWNGKEMLHWYKEHQMVYLKGKSGYKEMITYSLGSRKHHDNELIIMQFTGLHDKNGREIYEGDIVKCPVSLNNHIYGDFTNRVVKWKEDSFTWVFDSPFSWGRFESNVTGEGDYIKYTENGVEILIEVVGNIHQNPELIKQTT